MANGNKTFQDLVDATANAKTNVTSLRAFADNYKVLLEQALANAGGITPDQQAAMNQVHADILANDQTVVDAMAANVPPTPPVTP